MGCNDNLVNLIQELKRYSDNKELNSLLKNVEHKVDAPYKIIVLGEFSAGKSTFINALLGGEYAEISNLPTTAVITEFKYGKKDECIVSYKSGKKEEINPKQFSEISVKKDGKSSKVHDEINYIERTLPIQDLKKITLLDSPGFNDIDSKNDIFSDALIQYLREADLILWVFSANHIGRKTEEEYLKQVYYYTGIKPIAIINKVDMIDEEEEDIEEIRAELAYKAREYFDENNIFAISAKEHLEGKNNKEIIELKKYLKDTANSLSINLKDKMRLLEIVYTLIIRYPEDIFIKEHCGKILDYLTRDTEFYNKYLINVLRKYLEEIVFTKDATIDGCNKVLKYMNNNISFWLEHITRMFILTDLLELDIENPEILYKKIKQDIEIDKDNNSWLKESDGAGCVLLKVWIEKIIASIKSKKHIFNIYRELPNYLEYQYMHYGINKALLECGEFYGDKNNKLFNISRAEDLYLKYIEEITEDDLEKAKVYMRLAKLFFEGSLPKQGMLYIKEVKPLISNQPDILFDVTDYMYSYAKSREEIEECIAGFKICVEKANGDIETKSKAINKIIKIYKNLISSYDKPIHKEALMEVFINALIDDSISSKIYDEFIDYIRAYKLLNWDEISRKDTQGVYLEKLGNYFYYKNNYNYAFKCMKAAEKYKRWDVLFYLGYMYGEGLGVEKNEKLMIEQYLMAIEKGVAGGAVYNNLGCAYKNGRGANQDSEKAFYYYELSAKENDEYGCQNLALCYQYGTGCDVDEKKALEFMLKSNELGKDDAAFYLARYYFYGIGEMSLKKSYEFYNQYYKVNKDQALKLKDEFINRLDSYDVKENSEIKEEAYLLAEAYYYGYYKPEDEDKGMSLYNVLADNGNKGAVKFVIGMYYKFIGEPINFSRVEKLYKKVKDEKDKDLSEVYKEAKSFLEKIHVRITTRFMIILEIIILIISMALYNSDTIFEFFINLKWNSILDDFFVGEGDIPGQFVLCICIFVVFWCLRSLLKVSIKHSVVSICGLIAQIVVMVIIANLLDNSDKTKLLMYIWLLISINLLPFILVFGLWINYVIKQVNSVEWIKGE